MNKTPTLAQINSMGSVPILGQKTLRGMLLVGGQCPVCQFPIFVHEVLGGKKPERTPLAFCQHEGFEVELRVPLEDKPEDEREVLVWLFNLIHQQQDTLARALMLVQAAPDLVARTSDEGSAHLVG